MANKIQNPLASNNIISSKVFFDDKNYYFNVILPYVYLTNNKVNFNDLYKNNAMYGLVDNNFDVIVPKKDFIVPIPSFNSNQQNLLDFAAEAFIGMREYIANACKIGKVNPTGPFGNLLAHKSYSDPDLLVKQQQQTHATEFKQLYISETNLNSKITNAKSFNKEYISYLKNAILNGSCVTKSSIILSKIFTAFNNGLTFDISTETECDSDEMKYDKYLSSNDFLPFKEACRRFGFSIDLNIPWRLTLDLLSPAMQKIGDHEGYLYKKDISGLEDVFDKRYDKVYKSELLHLKTYFYNSYIEYLKDNLNYEKDYNKLAGNSIKNIVFYNRQVLSYQQYINNFDDYYWLKLYTYFRNLETRTGLTQQQFENVLREASHYLKINKIDDSLKYLNQYFKNVRNVDYFYTLQSDKPVLKPLSSFKMPDILL
jgi:hypothetical protein